MATGLDFAIFVCEQLNRPGELRYKKMFGEYMVYVNDKPVLLLCDNTVYVKKLDCLLPLMENAPTGVPYAGAKEHYVLDIENRELCDAVIPLIESVTSVPKKKNKRNNDSE